MLSPTHGRVQDSVFAEVVGHRLEDERQEGEFRAPTRIVFLMGAPEGGNMRVVDLEETHDMG